MLPIEIQVCDQAFSIEIFEKATPMTSKAFLEILPFKIDLHYAKIAGDEFFAIIPLVQPLEGGTDVSKIQPGTVAYYPVRQCFCVYYGKLQEEEASVTVLGRVTSDLNQVNKIGEELRQQQGKIIFLAELTRKGQVIHDDAFRFISPAVDEYEVEVWKTIPEEILRLRQLGGVMQPAGPLLYAEAESRNFHEWLYLTYQNIIKKQLKADLTKHIILPHLSSLRAKMAGWYHLERTAQSIIAFEKAFRESHSIEEIGDLCEHLILFIGRINMWIDTLVPWNDINENFRDRPLPRIGNP